MFRMISIPSGWFWPVLLGTIFQASAAPFIINSQIIVANKWFSDKERALATSLFIVSMPIGTAVAFLLTGHYFADISGDNKQNLNDLLKTQSIIFTFVYISF